MQNVVYTGALVHHREETVDFLSKKRKAIEPEKQVVIENAHPAIITKEEHLAALEKMRTKADIKVMDKKVSLLILPVVLTVVKV